MLKSFYKPRILLVYITILLIFAFIVQAVSHTATVVTVMREASTRKIIVIDAGHGGVDGGAISCTGKSESELNLEIALRLADLLHLLGFETKMIRTTNASVYSEGNTIASQKISDLKNRVRIVNETPNAILISIHQNTFSNDIYSGAQVFYSQTDGSSRLAELIQKNFCTTINIGSRRLSKQGRGIYLLENIQKCGVLVECGFLSNWEEESKLKQKSYQNKICAVIASALSVFCNT